MQIEVIYTGEGTFQPVRPLRLKQSPLRLVINVPDEAIDTSDTTATPTEPPQKELATDTTNTSTYSDRVNQILAPYQHLLKPTDQPPDYKAIWKEHLFEKYMRSHETSDL